MSVSRCCAFVLVLGVVAASAVGCDGASEGAGDVTRTVSALPGSGVDLVAIGSLSGNISDLSADTAGALENGVPGNLLGGMGSGIAFAGGNTFVAVPDRGPNAVSYDSAVDDTASYINRLQTVTVSLDPSAPGSALPLVLTETLVATTLFLDKGPLVYGTGAGLGVGSGVPALNGKHTNYFTGRSDNFDPTQPSSDTSDARLDPESVRVSADGAHVFVSDEYGPYVYEFHRKSGERKQTFTLPPELAITNLSPQGAVEIAGNTVGRVANKGMEGLAIAPDGGTLFGAMQSPLLQDGGTNGRFTRILTIPVRGNGTIQQFAYELTNIGTAAKPKFPTVSEVLAVNDHQLLVDERDGNGRGDNSTATYKKIYLIDLTGAQDVTGISGDANLAGKAVAKTLFLDVVQALNAHGIGSKDIPAKLEGMAFGPDVVIDGATKHTLFVSNDNDFVGTVVDSNHPNGIDNPNQMFVFAVDPAALPDFVPQIIGDGSDQGD
jgi:hypothetical protein